VVCWRKVAGALGVVLERIVGQFLVDSWNASFLAHLNRSGLFSQPASLSTRTGSLACGATSRWVRRIASSGTQTLFDRFCERTGRWLCRGLL
jgi:hypothetical protein